MHESFVVKYSTIIMSISQISETLLYWLYLFFKKRFGIKQVMLISMIAWVLRFGLFFMVIHQEFMDDYTKLYCLRNGV